MNFNLNYKSLATVIVWVFIVAWACYFFYRQELEVADMAPKVLAMQGMNTDELSYVYEADLSGIYDTDSNKLDNDISKGIFVYMYEDKKKGAWGRIIIYDRSTSSFKYIIKTSWNDKISGVAFYLPKEKVYSNNDYDAGQELSGCQIIINLISTDKVKYQLIDKANEDRRGCQYYRPNSNIGDLLTNIIHRKI